MRILVLSNFYPPHFIGSYELQCYQVCHELQKRGHRVHVLTSAPSPGSHEPYPQDRVVRKLELYAEDPHPSPGFNRLLRTVRFDRKILEQQLALILPEAIMIWGMNRLPVSLLQTVEASGIPCLYAVCDHWLGEACSWDPWLNYWSEEDASDPPFARTLLRGFHLDGFVRKKAPAGDTERLRLENIFFCSEFLKQATSRGCNLSFDQARVIPCGISPAEIRRRSGPPAHTGRLLFIARLSEEKDPITVIRAIQELRHQNDDRFTLDIYGRGKPEYEAFLHDYVRRFQLGGSVSFKPAHEVHVRDNIHLYDTLVFASKYPEPFPLVHLKAMAARVPVITTLEGGTGEFVRHGENALAFETGNQFDLANKIVQLADDPSLRGRLVDAAYQEVTQHYTLGRTTSRIESLLHRAARTEGAMEEAV